MEAFSYLSVLLSIILGLAIAQVLQGYRAILLARGRVRHSAPVLIWSGLLLLFATQAWWASFALRDRTQWDFLSFSIILLQLGLLYMLTALIFPDVRDDGRTDLGQHFDRHRTVFFGLIVAMLAASITKEALLTHALPSPLNLAFHLMFMGLAVLGMLMRAYRAQLLLSIAAGIGFLAYIALLFERL